MKTRRNPTSVHEPLGPYVHQVESVGEGRLLAVAGQIGMTPDGNVPQAPGEQLEIALENVLANLSAAQMSPPDIIKLTIFLTEEIPPDERRRLLTAALGDAVPAMTLVYVAALAAPMLKAEVEVFASAPSDPEPEG